MQADWYFDFISPFAYLQLGPIHRLRERVAIRPVPVLLGAVLEARGQLGPAEIPVKREFTYRFALWTAERAGIPMRFPPAHPFNPIAALRLAIAAGTNWAAIDAIFEHIWKAGRAGDAVEALTGVARALGIDDPAAAVARDEVKQALRANTDAALAAGVFGVPTLAIGETLFWGNDATPMIADFLDDPARFRTGAYERLATLPEAIRRRR